MAKTIGYRVVWIVLSSAAVLGCDNSEGGDGYDDEDDTATSDETVDLWSRDHVLDIEIDMAPDDWEALRYQSRSLFDVIGSSCLEEPPPRPFTYFPATVTIDGYVTENVGVRKKGFFGSLSEDKPSLKVKFSEYDPDLEFAGEKRLTLNNSISDESYVKQCLGYDLFRAAGVPAPRCGFATVSVNGDDLGVFVNVESIKKRFLRQHFSDDEGHLYEGALSDFRAGWVETFQVKTNKDAVDRSDLQALTSVLEAPEPSVAKDVAPLVDIDAFLRFWAAEYLIMHMDGYARNTNNFYIYGDPESQRFFFIPWGIDAIMWENATLPWEAVRPEGAVWAEGILARRLYNDNDTRDRYFEQLQALLDTVWNETGLHEQIDQMEALIRPFVPKTETRAFDVFLEYVRDFVSSRRTTVQEELSLRPDYSGALREPWCTETLGTISGTFDTQWGDLDVADPFDAGEGTLSITVNGEEIELILVSTLSGYGESGPPSVRFVAAASETEVWLAEIGEINPSLFTDGETVPLDWSDSVGILVRLDFSEGEELEVIGMIGEGYLRLTDAGTTPGDRVAGDFEGVVFEAVF